MKNPKYNLLYSLSQCLKGILLPSPWRGAGGEAVFLLTLLVLSGCSEDLSDGSSRQSDSNRIQLSSEIDQLAVSRVNDGGFCDGDVMGVYIVDYDGNTPGTLLASGNRGDNVRHTFDEANYKWSSAYDLYWKDKHTHIDVYGYYPVASSIDDVNSYSFEVQRDQSTTTSEGEMGGYEASDFLWGKTADVAPTTSVVRLPVAHKMANARVTLVEGSGFSAGEWAQTDKVVLTCNTIRKATINLADGTVSPSGSVEQTSTTPSRVNDEWRTIVVPQTVKAGTTMFSITIGGIPYKFAKSEDFTYTAGKMSNFAIRVDKKAASGQYQLTLISESITPWENDLVSHDATAKEYVIINSTAGHLKDSIAAAGKDYTRLKHLKIKGQINADDFVAMRDEMYALTALNLKEARIKGGYSSESSQYEVVNGADDEIPAYAFNRKNLLTNLVLPDTLTKINSYAFYYAGLSGSLNIPEGVTEICFDSFGMCQNLTGSLTLPSTLKRITGINAFENCNFNCELKLPEGIEEVGEQAFIGCRYFYGELKLPESLKKIGTSAFNGCTGFSGNLEIPQSITSIPAGAFYGCAFGGNLQLHDGIGVIGSDAFSGCGFKGELVLPKGLRTIQRGTFYNCDFSGELQLPDGLTYIGERAFAYNWRLMGVLEIPDEVISLGAGAFAQCRSLEGVIFPASLENIAYESSYYEDGGAFQNCYGIGSIVCKGEMPPTIKTGTFDGVAKDNFTLEVPESAIQQYQAAAGWGEFKRIAAHHELVCRPSLACALNTEHKQTLVINAEGDWEVESKPDWCEVSPSSGSKKTEVTLTINAMAKGSADRTGEVVFKLKDKEYTHKCSVSQYDYEYGEDEWITLQKATKGNNGGINIVLLGDGYNAQNISSGDLLKNIKQEVEYFFDIEPYKTYRDYFNVYTAMPLSTETGVGTVNTIRYNRFNTTFIGGVGLKADYDEVFAYALNAPTVTKSNLCQTLIIMIPNSTDYGGICQMWADGSAIAFCPQSTYGYPLDTRGVIQHEAGGHGFGKLGDEYIYHNAFIDFCDCTCCPHDFSWEHSMGWFQNLSMTGKMHEVPWSQFIFDSRYSDIVDIYEGGYMHNRGVFRSEQNSCMNNDIPYYSTISRYSIVKRIKEYAGESFTFEDFVKNDSRDATVTADSRGAYSAYSNVSAHTYQKAPVIHKTSPLKGKKVRRHK